MGLIDWLRRLVGAGSARAPKPAVKVKPVVAVRRDRDELTSFISASSAPAAPEPAAEATVAVAAPLNEGTTEGADVVEDSVVDAPEVSAEQAEPVSIEEPSESPAESPEPSPVDAVTEPVVEDSEATLMLELPPEPEEAPDQEATLFFEVPRQVIGKLVVIKGELKGEEYELRDGDNEIGRSSECQIVLPSMWISRTHAVLRCQGDQIEIESLSDKITSVDGEPVTGSIAIGDGAKIQLGGTICRVELEG